MKYDFTRCNNLQFKVHGDEGEVMTGYLKVAKENEECVVYVFFTDRKGCETYDKSLQLVTRDYARCELIEDFSKWAEKHDLEIVPRDPETYKDWKVGDRIKFKGLEGTCEIAAKLGDIVFLLRENGSVGTTSTTTLTEPERVVLVLTDYEQELLAQQKEKCPFEKDDKVLVKDRDMYWRFDVFGYYEENARYPYVCKCSEYELCIPLNEHTWQLLGTMDEYKEEE